MEFKEKLISKKSLYGMIVTLGLPTVSEMLSECGLDWLWIDMEHAPLSLMDVQLMAQAKNRNCAALVRIPINSDEWIKRVFDLGVEGIIIPHVSTKEETERAVLASYYPPEGNRGIGPGRAGRYGMDAEYKKEANSKRLLFVQIEDREGVENAQEIAQVPGLDGIIIGPYDLSASYGKLGQLQDPQIVEAMERVMKACKSAQKPIGIFAKTPDDAKKYQKLGFQLIAVGVDSQYLWSSAKGAIDLAKV